MNVYTDNVKRGTFYTGVCCAIAGLIGGIVAFSIQKPDEYLICQKPTVEVVDPYGNKKTIQRLDLLSESNKEFQQSPADYEQEQVCKHDVIEKYNDTQVRLIVGAIMWGAVPGGIYTLWFTFLYAVSAIAKAARNEK